MHFCPNRPDCPYFFDFLTTAEVRSVDVDIGAAGCDGVVRDDQDKVGVVEAVKECF